MRLTAAPLLFLGASCAMGKCIPYPDLMAEVDVETCQSFSVTSSLALSSWEMAGDFPIHKPGQRHVATLISGVVTSTRFVAREPNQRMSHSFDSYIPLGLAHLELDGAASSACPVKLPATITVIANPRCCDVLPSSGECVSPFVRVVVEPEPESWHTLIPPGGSR